jgi:AraC-like DNA-binding protein
MGAGSDRFGGILIDHESSVGQRSGKAMRMRASPLLQAWRDRDVSLGSWRISGIPGALASEGPEWGRLAIEVPRSPMRVHREGGRGSLADPTVALVHNAGDRDPRTAVDPRGVTSDWISFEPEVLFEIRPDLEASWASPFRSAQVPLPGPMFVLLRCLVELADTRAVDPKLMREATLRLLELCLGPFSAGGPMLKRQASPAALDMVERTREPIVANPGAQHSLELLALHVGCSPYHLARVFHRTTGRTIHDYLVQLRLRLCYFRIREPGSDLLTLALEHGFSSHSHFTAAFRKSFGVTPTGLRQSAASVDEETIRRLLRETGVEAEWSASTAALAPLDRR